MKEVTVSIIMSTYNNEQYVADAIRSVLSQTYTHWEFIIINDASTDNTGSVIKKFLKKERRIKYYENKHSRGQTTNIVRGVSLSKGKYIAKIDGDDLWLRMDKLQKQVDFLELDKKRALVGTWGYYLSVDGKRIQQIVYPIADQEIRSYMLIENCFIHSSVLIRKSVLKKSGGYDTRRPLAQDYDLWLRCGLIGSMHNIDECMVGYRINPTGITQTRYKRQLNETISFIKAHRNHYPHYTIALFLWWSRKFIPRNVRMFLSAALRKQLFIKKPTVVLFKKAYA